MPAPYACDPARSNGRLVAERESALRSAFQRDRDRIIHASAFRRLMHKTQVFVVHEGDSYRTRLTHSLEVAQVARTMAGALGLDVDLAEAVALAHDLGHPPFGHTGEEALAEAMAPFGGFDHNAQAIRIVTRIERHYAAFDGLNLSWETLEGLAKHNGPVTGQLPWALADLAAHWDLELATHASAEAQVAALADDIAYNAHDLHDGLRAGLFGDDDLAALPVLAGCYGAVDREWPGLEARRRRHEALRGFFGQMVEAAVAEARERLNRARPATEPELRALTGPVAAFPEALTNDLAAIRAFLFERMYRAPPVVEMRRRVAGVVAALFPLYLARPDHLPARWQHDVAEAGGDKTALARVVCDYVAGMTDRYAMAEHERLIGPAWWFEANASNHQDFS